MKTRTGGLFNTHNYLVKSKDIRGGWSEPVYLNSSGFDPSVFHDTDGKMYIVNMINNFGGFGQQGYGYNVHYLYTEIGKILGLDTVHPMIILGAGNLGQALANYVDFEKRGFRLVGIFDVNPVLEGIAVRGLEIQMLSELPFFLRENNVEIAILTLPKNKAKEMADILVENGIKAIWNFAHLDLETPDDVIVENVHLSESLMTLSYNLSKYRQEHVDK